MIFDTLEALIIADTDKLNVLLHESFSVLDMQAVEIPMLSAMHEGQHDGTLNFSKKQNQKIRLRSLSCGIGAYFIKSYSKIDVLTLKKWKTNPLNFPQFTDQMVSDFTFIIKKRKIFAEFLTVPPPSGKRNEYTNYPIEIVAKLVSESINIPYLRCFAPRKLETNRGKYARLKEEREEFIFDIIPLKTVGLVLDDVTTTRKTFEKTQHLFEAHGKMSICIAWCGFH